MESYYNIKIELPNGTIQNFSEKLNSHKPIFDLFIELCSKYKLQPSNFKLNLYDNQHDLINYGPNRSLNQFKSNSIEIVSKKSTQNKRPNDESCTKFDVTIRVQVDLPQNQKTAIRVSPNVQLKQLYQLICEENLLNESDYKLKLKNFELNENDLKTKSLKDFNTNQVELVFTGSSYNSSPSSIKNGIRGSSLSIYDDINSIASNKASKSIFNIFKKRAKLKSAMSKTSLNSIDHITCTTPYQKPQESTFASKKKKQAPLAPKNSLLPPLPKNFFSNEYPKSKEPIFLLNTKKKYAPIAPPLVNQVCVNEKNINVTEVSSNVDNNYPPYETIILKSTNSPIIDLSLLIDNSDQKVPSNETLSSSTQNDDSTQADCSDMADFPPPPEIPQNDDITQDTSEVLHELDFLDDERTMKSDDLTQENINSIIESETDATFSCLRDPLSNEKLIKEKSIELDPEDFHVSKINNVSIIESELVTKIESNLTLNENIDDTTATKFQKEEEKSYRVIHSAEVIEKDGAYISLDGTVRGFPGAVKKIATSCILNDLFVPKSPSIESSKKSLDESLYIAQPRLTNAIESEKKDVDKANLKNFLNNHLSKKLEIMSNTTKQQQHSVIKQSAFVMSAKNKTSNFINGPKLASMKTTNSTYI
jgi:hypothetical protein